jgi:hypothetical protein
LFILLVLFSSYILSWYNERKKESPSYSFKQIWSATKTYPTSNNIRKKTEKLKLTSKLILQNSIRVQRSTNKKINFII